MMSPVPVVLVVEDNAELRAALKDALTSEGYRVLTVKDEAEAVETLRTTPANLLIADLTDPPDAERALDTVRGEFPDLPVVALSEAAGPHPAFFFTAWESPPGVRTLSRPFRLAELLAVSREVLDSGPQQTTR